MSDRCKFCYGDYGSCECGGHGVCGKCGSMRCKCDPPKCMTCGGHGCEHQRPDLGEPSARQIEEWMKLVQEADEWEADMIWVRPLIPFALLRQMARYYPDDLPMVKQDDLPIIITPELKAAVITLRKKWIDRHGLPAAFFP